MLILATEQLGPHRVFGWTDVVWTPGVLRTKTTVVREVNEMGGIEATLAEVFGGAGFHVVDPQVLRGKLAPKPAFEMLDLSSGEARNIAEKSDADYVVIAKGTAQLAYHAALADAGMQSGQGNVVARLVRVRDGKVVGVDDAARGRGAHRRRHRAPQRHQLGGASRRRDADAKTLRTKEKTKMNKRMLLWAPAADRCSAVRCAPRIRRPTTSRRRKTARPAARSRRRRRRRRRSCTGRRSASASSTSTTPSHPSGYWGGSRDALAEAARDAATEALVKSGAFVVVEREQLAQVLREQGLGMTGAISPQTAAKAGKLLGLQALVTGKITDFDADNKTSGFGGYYQKRTKTFHARVSLRMVDATTGEIWVAESGEGASNQSSTMVMGGGEMSEDQTLGKRALYMAVHNMINKVIAKADAKPWSGAVAKIGKGGKIYITARQRHRAAGGRDAVGAAARRGDHRSDDGRGHRARARQDPRQAAGRRSPEREAVGVRGAEGRRLRLGRHGHARRQQGGRRGRRRRIAAFVSRYLVAVSSGSFSRARSMSPSYLRIKFSVSSTSF